MKFRVIAVVASLLTLSPSAQASEAYSNYITGISVTDSGIAFVSHPGARTAVPACHTAATSRFAINTQTAGGANMFAGILTAYSLRKKVFIQGTNSCTTSPDTESVAYYSMVES